MHSSLFLSFIIVSFLILSAECLVQSNNLIYNAHGQQTEKDPAFQDSYWTDKTIASGNNSDKLEEKEVGPNEGIATLAVVLVNKAQSEITSVKGYLSLPSQFQAVKTRPVDLPNSTFTFNTTEISDLNANNTSNDVFSTSNTLPNLSNIAVASYDSIVQPGEEFTFYFDINVLSNANIGLYEASLDLVYSKVLTAGDVVVEDIVVPFRIPGKVILDVKSNDQYLSPGEINRVNIDIINKGSAHANSAIITISNTDDNSQDSLTTVSSSTENIEPADNNDINRNNNNTTPNDNSSSTIIARNEDNNTTSSSLTTIGTQRFSIGTIPEGEIISIPLVLYPAITASEELQNLNVEVTYGNPLGNRETIDFSLGFVISAQPTESNFDVYFRSNYHHNDDSTKIQMETNSNNTTNFESDTNTITAGTIQGIGFTIEKTTPSEINDVIISISPSSDSVKLLGSSRWSFETLTDRTINVNTNVFASEDLIGNPVQFNVDIKYILNGLSKSETLGLGMYIDGNINISAYDFELNTIGDEPNLVANLLNEGNMDALFTTVEMIPPPVQAQKNKEENWNKSLLQEYPSLQYVGDLAENSPLPISIPLNIPNGTQAGDYPVFIKVSYKDNLRNTHEIIVQGTVEYTPTIDQSLSEGGLLSGLGNNPLLLVVITVVVFAVIILLIVRSIKKKRKMQRIRSISADENSKSDLDSLLEK